MKATLLPSWSGSSPLRIIPHLGWPGTPAARGHGGGQGALDRIPAAPGTARRKAPAGREVGGLDREEPGRDSVAGREVARLLLQPQGRKGSHQPAVVTQGHRGGNLVVGAGAA